MGDDDAPAEDAEAAEVGVADAPDAPAGDAGADVVGEVGPGVALEAGVPGGAVDAPVAALEGLEGPLLRRGLVAAGDDEVLVQAGEAGGDEVRGLDLGHGDGGLGGVELEGVVGVAVFGEEGDCQSGRRLLGGGGGPWANVTRGSL